jgi:hypothetical protein
LIYLNDRSRSGSNFNKEYRWPRQEWAVFQGENFAAPGSEDTELSITPKGFDAMMDDRDLWSGGNVATLLRQARAEVC